MPCPRLVLLLASVMLALSLAATSQAQSSTDATTTTSTSTSTLAGPTPPPTCSRSYCSANVPDECRYSSTCVAALNCLNQAVTLGYCSSFDTCSLCTSSLTTTQKQAAVDYMECYTACNPWITTGNCSFECFSAAKACMDDNECQAAFICLYRANYRDVRAPTCANGLNGTALALYNAAAKCQAACPIVQAAKTCVPCANETAECIADQSCLGEALCQSNEALDANCDDGFSCGKQCNINSTLLNSTGSCLLGKCGELIRDDAYVGQCEACLGVTALCTSYADCYNCLLSCTTTDCMALCSLPEPYNSVVRELEYCSIGCSKDRCPACRDKNKACAASASCYEPAICAAEAIISGACTTPENCANYCNATSLNQEISACNAEDCSGIFSPQCPQCQDLLYMCANDGDCYKCMLDCRTIGLNCATDCARRTLVAPMSNVLISAFRCTSVCRPPSTTTMPATTTTDAAANGTSTSLVSTSSATTARPPPPTPPPTCTRSNCVPRLPDECRYSATCSQAVGCLSQSVLLGDCESFDSCPDCTLGLTPTQTQAAIDYAECSAACNTAIRTGTCSFDCFAAAKTCMDDDDCQGAYICYIRAYLRSVRAPTCGSNLNGTSLALYNAAAQCQAPCHIPPNSNTCVTCAEKAAECTMDGNCVADGICRADQLLEDNCDDGASCANVCSPNSPPLNETVSCSLNGCNVIKPDALTPRCEACLGLTAVCTTNSDCYNCYLSCTSGVCVELCSLPHPYNLIVHALRYCSTVCRQSTCPSCKAESAACTSNSSCSGPAICAANAFARGDCKTAEECSVWCQSTSLNTDLSSCANDKCTPAVSPCPPCVEATTMCIHDANCFKCTLDCGNNIYCLYRCASRTLTPTMTDVLFAWYRCTTQCQNYLKTTTVATSTTTAPTQSSIATTTTPMAELSTNSMLASSTSRLLSTTALTGGQLLACLQTVCREVTAACATDETCRAAQSCLAASRLIDDDQCNQQCVNGCLRRQNVTYDSPTARLYYRSASCVQRCMNWPIQRTFIVRATLRLTGISLTEVQGLRAVVLRALRNFVGPRLRDFVSIVRIYGLSSGARRETNGAQVDYTVETTGEEQRQEAVNTMSDTSSLLTELQNEYSAENPTGSNPFASASVSSTAPEAVEQSTGNDGSSKKKSSNGSAIAGAVLGSVLGAILLAGLVLAVMRRRREQRAPPPKFAIASKAQTYQNPAFTGAPNVYESAIVAAEDDLARGSQKPMHEPAFNSHESSV